jgi:hypothetical protein
MRQNVTMSAVGTVLMCRWSVARTGCGVHRVNWTVCIQQQSGYRKKGPCKKKIDGLRKIRFATYL